MAKTDLARFELQLEKESFAYRSPIKFGGRVVTDELSSRCSVILSPVLVARLA